MKRSPKIKQNWDGDMTDRAKAILELNKELADLLGTPKPVRITCVKPRYVPPMLIGSVSAGIEPIHQAHYIRRLRYGDDPRPDVVVDEPAT